MSSRIISIMLDPMCTHTGWFKEMIAGVQKAASAAQRTVQLIDRVEGFDPAAMSQAVILAGVSHRNLLKAVENLHACRKQIILAGMDADSLSSPISCVTHSRSRQTVQLIQYLRACGRKRIALVGVGRSSLNDQARVDVSIRYTLDKDQPITKSDVYDWSERLTECFDLFYPCLHQYDAVICPNDYVALYLVNRLKDRGVKLPEQLYIASFSNHALCRYCVPSIPSIAMDFNEIGRYAYSVWLQYEASPEESPVYKVIVPSHLIVRESTGNQRPENLTLESSLALWPDRGTDIFYNEPSVRMLMQIGSCLDNHDKLDRKIIHCILDGMSYEAIVDKLYISSGSLHYRVNKLYRELNCQGRAQFMELLTQWFGDFQDDPEE